MSKLKIIVVFLLFPFFPCVSLIASFPPGALIIDVNDVRNEKEIQTALHIALSRESKSFQHILRVWEFLKRTSVFQNRLPPSFDRIVYLRQNGRTILPVPSRGELTFRFQGWTSDEEQKLKAFVQMAYPVIKQVYGEPAWGGTVSVLNDTSLNDWQVFLAGIYNVSTATIHMEWGRSDDIETYYRLLHLMLHAFHGPYQIGFDAWEEGIAWAATRVIFSKLFPACSFSYYCTFYLFPSYELLNQPSLSASTFWPKSLTDCSGYMVLWRHSQALSAWLKVYIENPGFFSSFNSLYYQQVKADPSTASNLAKLKDICNQIVPTVEGLSFDEWYAQQYVLQPTFRYGPNLFVLNIPVVPLNPDQEGYSVYLGLFYFYSTGNDETPLSGVVTPRYWNYDFSIDLPVESQYETITITDGVGFCAPTFFNIGGPQRVTIEFPIGGLNVSIVFPYGVVGTEAEPNNIYGALKTGTTGTLLINGQDVVISQGAFGVPFPSLSTGPQQLDVVYVSPGGERLERKINCFYGPYAIIIQPPREKQVVRRSFSNGIYMISPPVDPVSHDPAIALGIEPEKLALARWEPTKAGSSKYIFYPDLSLSLGKGYFIRFLDSKDIQLEGYAEPLDGEFTIGLAVGWNQIGYPFPQGECALADILVRIPELGEPVSLADANKQGYLAKTLWRFNPQTGEYESLDPAKDTLVPWEGYWIRCYKECSLIIPGPEHNKGFKRIRNSRISPTIGWQAKIEVEINGQTRTLILGQAENSLPSFSLEFPPSIKGSPKASFLDATRNTYLAWDIKPLSPSAEWLLQVSGEGECVLRWRDLSFFPRGYSLIMTDLATGKKISLLHSTYYKFISDGGTRFFSIQMSRKNPLLISDLLVKTTRGGVEFSFALSRDAEAEVRVESIDGRTLKVIRINREAGINSVYWDGRSEKGGILPAGVYIFRVRAYSEGEMVQAIRLFTLR